MNWITVSAYAGVSKELVFKGNYDAREYPTVKAAVAQFCREMWIAAMEDEVAFVENAELLLRSGLCNIYPDGNCLIVEVYA